MLDLKDGAELLAPLPRFRREVLGLWPEPNNTGYADACARRSRERRDSERLIQNELWDIPCST